VDPVVDSTVGDGLQVDTIQPYRE